LVESSNKKKGDVSDSQSETAPYPQHLRGEGLRRTFAKNRRRHEFALSGGGLTCGMLNGALR
jgi:hypothetical protein